MKKLTLLLLTLAFSFTGKSEDIELYIGNSSQNASARPQVLLIFDNSGSMRNLEVVNEPYDPNTTYPAVGGLNALQERMVYFTKGSSIDGATGIVPDSPSEVRRFLADINSCATARERLATVGFYIGQIREYSFSGNSGSWQEIPDNNGANIEVIDCEDDVLQIPANPEVNAGIENNQGNITQLPDGYPVDGQGTRQNPVYHTANAGDSNVVWGGEVVTLYSDNYLRWANSTNLQQVNRTRMDIAKDTISNLVASAPSVDFGLQIFNHNHSGENTRDGGRVVYGIKRSTNTTRTELIDIVNSDLDPETNTPLCETLYEARRYFGGLSVDFGDDDSDRGDYRANTPPRDTTVEQGNNYITPFTSCIDKVYVIMITDGVPTRDHASDTYVAGLTNVTGVYNYTVDETDYSSYLPALAGWMFNNDINANLDEDQTAVTYTIGFGEDAINEAGALLTETATRGGGEYFPASDSTRLLSSLQAVLTQILAVNTTFTSPSVASNNFDRTETLDSVYYGMFIPGRGARWQGNLKKLKVVDGQQKDRNDVAAIDSTGNIDDQAHTYWSSGTDPDGNDVSKGGVVEMLSTKTNRNILTNMTSNSNTLSTFSRTLAENFYGSAANLATALDVNQTDIDDYLNWALGKDVDDLDNDSIVTEPRPDVFGDPLHSKPLVINYGGASESNQDVRIIVGTNAGALHMFKDNGSTVDENWVFMPNEFVKNYKKLKDNFANTGKVYGIDGPATSYLLDVNGDGAISDSDGDKAWIFFGLRRGGTSYYGMDVSDPAAPELMWVIDGGSGDFAALSQSWSQPRVAHSTLNIVNGVPQPVLIFGGGYDINKDSGGPGSGDNNGKGIFIVDAATGTLKWSLTGAATTATNTQFTAFTDSIPSSIGVLDSDSDGLVDRLYFGDAGGNVWRVDMPGSNPFSTLTPWTAHKLASLGGITNLDDRRFFSEPSIARTFITDTIQTTTTDENGNQVTKVTRQDRPYEAILIGSGDRSNPLGVDTEDKFFMIKDPNIYTTSFVAAPTGDQKAIPTPIVITELANFTNNPFGATLTTQQLETLELSVSAKKGWYVDYGTGEKSTAEAIAIKGVAYFTSFTPANNSGNNTCQLADGSGQLYAIDLERGTTVYNWRKKITTTGIPDTPSIIITKPPVSPPCVVNCENEPRDPYEDLGDAYITTGGALEAINFNLQTTRSYMYVQEQ